MTKPFKIVVFDLDETLGYFTEFGIFCDCLNNYFKNASYSNTNFNELLDLYPNFLRPKIMNILRYLKGKKKENKCYKVMIYTNNQGDKSWAMNIKKYFDDKVEYDLFDNIEDYLKIKKEILPIKVAMIELLIKWQFKPSLLRRKSPNIIGGLRHSPI